MSTHKSFYKLIDTYGGVLDPSVQEPPFDHLCKMALSAARAMKDAINKRSDILWPLGDVRIELVANFGFNAFTHYDDKEEGIAIYAGLYFLLLDLSAILWANPAFLRRTHPTQLKRHEIDFYKEVVSHLSEDFTWKGSMYFQPPTEDRARRAYSMALTAFLFICAHEAGHLVRVHIPYLQGTKEMHSSGLFELNNKLRLTGSSLQQLEIDPDLYAARAIIDSAFTTWNLGRTFPIDLRNSRGGRMLYLTDILAGLALAFFCMDISSTDSSLKTESTHPVPAIR